MAAGGSQMQMPATGNVEHWDAVVGEVRRSLIPETPANSYGMLVLALTEYPQLQLYELTVTRLTLRCHITRFTPSVCLSVCRKQSTFFTTQHRTRKHFRSSAFPLYIANVTVIAQRHRLLANSYTSDTQLYFHNKASSSDTGLSHRQD